jgi:hypothetical protein
MPISRRRDATPPGCGFYRDNDQYGQIARKTSLNAASQQTYRKKSCIIVDHLCCEPAFLSVGATAGVAFVTLLFVRPEIATDRHISRATPSIA